MFRIKKKVVYLYALFTNNIKWPEFLKGMRSKKDTETVSIFKMYPNNNIVKNCFEKQPKPAPLPE